MSMTPYTVAIPQADIDDLNARLARVRWTDELPDAGTDYGVDLASIKRLVSYWQHGYDWRIWEARLNAYPQFTTTIDGENVHFLHVRSNVENALPLLLIHGWPKSVFDYLTVIDPLVDPSSHVGEPAQAFHLVIPSLPGFGFSGPTTQKGWDCFRMAHAFIELMHRLGYDRYGVHGSDWGAVISPEIGRFDPEHVVGVHVTAIFSSPWGNSAEIEALSKEEKVQWQRYLAWQQHQGGYYHMQSTAPQTLAHALADSPVGQLAWNYQNYGNFQNYGKYEKYGDGVSDDYVLTTAALYWFTNTAASSARLYYETAHSARVQHRSTEPTTVPLGLVNFAGDHRTIRTFAERDHKNIVSWNIYDRGNHFATQTAPDLLVNDMRTFFKMLRS
ncbi:epoxide hydrolase [Ktedonosporobacter rubrisoli]|uniref:Epoxide hydrolase n=1 Tax=Ktedonosporobacter rubrisoli TaxID=2509675 RepID=A0A4V0YZS3_KTERU|nr:epoxide hydrolase [Ktedonosporobacter rubrisoli]